MVKNNLHNDAKKAVEDANVALTRSGMSIGRKKFALKLLKAKEDLRRMRMVNVKPGKQKIK